MVVSGMKSGPSNEGSSDPQYATDVFDAEVAQAEVDRSYLLIFENNTSNVVSLPRTGDLLIGRAKDADVRLSDTSVSRNHARLSMMGGTARIIDLGSQNGTFVNGERIAGTRALLSGDVLTICTVSLVYHTSARAPVAELVVDIDALRRQMENEVDRAITYHRPFAVVAIAAPADESDRWNVARSLQPIVRRLDHLAWSGGAHGYILLPETGPDEATSYALGVLDALLQVNPRASVGYAACPLHGCDVDTLLAGARSALDGATPGSVHSAENAYRRLELGDRAVIIADEAMSRLYALLERLAAVDLPVLIYGETGTGKDLAAAAVHWMSARRDEPMVTLNCAAIPETLLEGELFGYARGAFSGATADKQGLFEAADGGTAFLDEIAELSPGAQAKLLRVLETGKLTRLGEVVERSINVRFVAATNRDLKAAVGQGRFREDLYFRLSGAGVWLPPLRDRKRELLILAQTFLTEAAARAGRPNMTLSEDAMQVLAAYTWPGNVRELKNAIEYVAATATGDTVEAWHIERRLYPEELGETPPTARLDPQSTAATDEVVEFRPIKEEIRELERRRIAQALAAADGNQTRAAALISMPLRTFVTKIKQYDLTEGAKTPR